MNTSTLNFTIISSAKTKFSDAQVLLQEFTGKKFSRNDAVTHKWNMSESLRRDVGFRVATIDFFENFYQPNKGVIQTEKLSKRTIRTPQFLRNAIRFYFESKGNLINY